MISDATPLEQGETVSSSISRTTSSDKREALLDFVIVGLACLVFLALSLYQLDLPGLYTDEAYDVIPAMQMVLGHHVELQGNVLDLGGLRLPLMSSSAYQGVTYTYLALPFFALGGANVISLRLMTVLVGVLGIVLTYFLGRAWFGRGVARISALLLAISPAWVFWSRLGAYVVSVVVPIATGALLAFTSWLRAHPKGSYWKLYLGMFLLGLGLSTKLLFLWFISAVILTSLILWGGLLWRHLRLIRESIGSRARVVFISLFAFSLGAFPFILYNILTRGTINLLRQTLSGPRTTSHGVDNTAIIRNLWTEVDAFKVVLDGGYFWFQGENQQPHANPVAPAIFAVAAIGLIALVLARRGSLPGRSILGKNFGFSAILLTTALVIASLQAIPGATGLIGTLLTLTSIILSLVGVVMLLLAALRNGDATTPAGWVLLAIMSIAGALWWFGGVGRPEGPAPGALLGLWPIDSAGVIFLLSGAGLLILLGADKNPVRHQRATVAALSLISLLVVQSTVTVSGLWPTHLVIVLPLPQIIIAAFAIELTGSIRDWLAEKRKRSSWAWMRVVPATLLVGAIVVGDAAVDGIYHHDLALLGGASTFSDAIYSLDRYLQTDKAGYKVVAMDWGFRRPLQLISNERVMAIEGYGLSKEPPPEFYTSLREFIKDERTVYLFHIDKGTAYPRLDAFLQVVADAGKEAVPDKTFKQRDGIPVYELYTVR
jgi:hypothetical protein